MKQTNLEHLETLLKASEASSNAVAAAMDAEVFAMMAAAKPAKLAKLAAATEFANNAYYAAHAEYVAASKAYRERT